MAHRKRTFSTPSASTSADADAIAPSLDQPNDNTAAQETGSEGFIGQWNRLVSTTNWEKGRIICEWREAILTSGAAVTEYSDETWAQLVGNVSSQHVGRLRRVFQRFGDVRDQYAGLYWSHFQAAIDWDDAEMWLEGAVQNDWSVSQMRGKRWETLGTTPESQRAEAVLDLAEIDEDAPSESAAENSPASSAAVAASAATVQPPEAAAEADREAPPAPSSQDAGASTQVGKRTRLRVNVEDLPDDLAEAFEQFKLAIIAHRREGWRDTTPDTVVACLDALQELALAPTDEK